MKLDFVSPTQAFSVAVTLLAHWTTPSEGHGAIISPPARNAVDRFLPEFQNGKAPKTSCNCGDMHNGCEEGIRAGGGGQPCLWFSQGCTIGCSTCTGIGSHSSTSLCNDTTVTATLPKYAWTMNRDAVEGSVNDSYRFNPWRGTYHDLMLTHYFDA